VNYALIALMAGTGIVITSAASCTSYLYRYRLRALESRLPVLSIAIIAVTVVITSLQFIFPEVLSLFRRSGDGLRAGEWWRIVTPLFVQPSGWSQCLFNGAFAIGFVPVAEKVYGRGLLPLYFVPGVLCQAINHVWTPDGGGSSSGLFAVMGGLLGTCSRCNISCWRSLASLRGACSASCGMATARPSSWVPWWQRCFRSEDCQSSNRRPSRDWPTTRRQSDQGAASEGRLHAKAIPSSGICPLVGLSHPGDGRRLVLSSCVCASIARHTD
jgi:membrane associated rhomboid family serine protease